MACIFGALGGAALIAIWSWFFYAPWVRRVLIGNENLKFYHVFYVMFVPEQPQRTTALTKWGRDTYAKEQAALAAEAGKAAVAGLDEKPTELNKAVAELNSITTDTTPVTISAHHAGTNNILEEALEQQLYAADGITAVPAPDAADSGIWGKVKGVLLHGVNQEVADHQKDKYAYLHDAAVTYESKTEELFSFLQVFTCSIASFAHGSNDVANAIGPLSVIYYIWQQGGQCVRLGKSTPVEIWILAYGGIAIDIGLATWGYNVMRSLGNVSRTNSIPAT